jgi:hypothetical protein
VERQEKTSATDQKQERNSSIRVLMSMFFRSIPVHLKISSPSTEQRVYGFKQLGGGKR